MKTKEQIYLGIDHGLKNIGLAFASQDTLLAVPFDIIDGTDQARAIEEIQAICLNEEVDVIIIGLPISKKGEDSKQTQYVRRFIDQLKKKTTLPVIEEDERFSTLMAAKSSESGDDSVSAAIILQSYLDREFRKEK